MCPASAMQMVGIEEAINPSIETGTLETDNSSFKYNSTGLEANHIRVSSCNDVEQLYPQINQFKERTKNDDILVNVLIDVAFTTCLVLGNVMTIPAAAGFYALQIAYSTTKDKIEHESLTNPTIPLNPGVLETNIINTSPVDDIEQLYPQINQYIDKLYGDKFYTWTATIAAILLTYGTIQTIRIAQLKAALAEAQKAETAKLAKLALIEERIAHLTPLAQNLEDVNAYLEEEVIAGYVITRGKTQAELQLIKQLQAQIQIALIQVPARTVKLTILLGMLVRLITREYGVAGKRRH